MAKKGTSCEVPGLRLRRTEVVPLVQQIGDGIQAAIKLGTRLPGTALPSSRELARQLGVSRNTVIAAYEELAAWGLIVTVKASRTLVAGGRRTPALKPWNGVRKGSGYPSKLREYSDPDGNSILVFSTAK